MVEPIPTSSAVPDRVIDEMSAATFSGFLGRRRGKNAENGGRQEAENTVSGAKMVPGAPQPVADIFEAMVGHRQRVVRQVAGVPAAAMRAAIDHGHKILEQHDPDFDGPEHLSFRQWLDNKANANFMAALAYSITPWGKESQKRQREDALAETDAQVELTRLRGNIADRVLTMTEQDASFLNTQDTALLTFMVDQGHFPGLPRVSNLYSPDSVLSPESHSALGVPGAVMMLGDRKGDYFGSLPGARQHHSNGYVDRQFGDFIGEYARDINEGNAPSEIRDHHHQIYTRWLVLFHEVAHTRFSQIETPFRPSDPALGKKQQQIVNRWISGPFSVAPNEGNTLLNENHSDALGAMLLLEASGHDPKAIETVLHFSQDRIKSRIDADLSNYDRLDAGSMGSQFDCLHATEWTLQRVVDNIDQWAGKPPHELRALALSYASDGLMDFVDPKRVIASGERVGRTYSDAIVAPEPCSLTTRRNLLNMVVAHAHGVDPIKQMRGLDIDPTVVQVMKSSWDAIKPQINALLTQELILDGAAGGTVAEGLRIHSKAALYCAYDLLSDPALPINDHDNRHYQAMVQAYQRDLPLMHQAFGVDPPSLSTDGIQRWRQARYGPTGKLENTVEPDQGSGSAPSSPMRLG